MGEILGRVYLREEMRGWTVVWTVWYYYTKFMFLCRIADRDGDFDGRSQNSEHNQNGNDGMERGFLADW